MKSLLVPKPVLYELNLSEPHTCNVIDITKTYPYSKRAQLLTEKLEILKN